MYGLKRSVLIALILNGSVADHLQLHGRGQRQKKPMLLGQPFVWAQSQGEREAENLVAKDNHEQSHITHLISLI